jgi:hypothetical protein
MQCIKKKVQAFAWAFFVRSNIQYDFCDDSSASFSSKVKMFLIVWFAFCLVISMLFLAERLVSEFGYRIKAGGIVRVLFGLLVLMITQCLDKKCRF